MTYMRDFFLRYRIILGGIAVFILGLLVIAALASAAPRSFPTGAVVSVKAGTTLSQAAELFQARGAIRSAFVFKAYGLLFEGRRGLKAGDYLLAQPESALRLAYRAVNGIEDIPKIKVTIPEGSNSREAAWLIMKAIPGFNAPAFIAQAKEGKLEGMLFPDTYFFPANIAAADAIALMRADFDQQIAALADDIKASGKTKPEILTMASIIEREAASSTDRRIIAGILWKRIKAGMALQVDSPFWYAFGKGTSDLTSDDLKADSPYNTYARTGLPPTPISNPGLAAIEDAAHPTDTKYWYYLSDPKGIMHYAATFDEHVANKRKYIK
jgi:UPF0755 protein